RRWVSRGWVSRGWGSRRLPPPRWLPSSRRLSLRMLLRSGLRGRGVSRFRARLAVLRLSLLFVPGLPPLPRLSRVLSADVPADRDHVSSGPAGGLLRRRVLPALWGRCGYSLSVGLDACRRIASAAAACSAGPLIGPRTPKTALWRSSVATARDWISR